MLQLPKMIKKAMLSGRLLFSGFALISCAILLACWLRPLKSHCVACDELAEFRRMHPSDARPFVDLQPASLRAAMMLVTENSNDALSIARSLKDKWGSVPGLAAYADQISGAEGAKSNRLRSMIQTLEEDLANGGAIFDYVWRDENVQETGLLVLKRGKLVRKIPFVSQHLR